jgi:hypothetical protein
MPHADRRIAAPSQPLLVLLVAIAFGLGWMLGSVCQRDLPATDWAVPSSEALNHYDALAHSWHQQPRVQPQLHPLVVAVAELLACLLAIVAAAPADRFVGHLLPLRFPSQ